MLSDCHVWDAFARRCGTISPGWFWAKKRIPQSFWLFLLPVAGIGLWVFLTALGIGAQSLANLIEVLGVVVAAVVAAYLKFFVFDRRFGNKPLGVVVAFVIVAVVTVAFRLFTPQLPGWCRAT
ncbi:MAG: hypothetical protein Q7U34_05370 [Anaerolineales bacterium]|nr:hypothetical protein [Anaerolineales bacterium]